MGFRAAQTEDLQTLQKEFICVGDAKPLSCLLYQMNLLLHGLELPNVAMVLEPS